MRPAGTAGECAWRWCRVSTPAPRELPACVAAALALPTDSLPYPPSAPRDQTIVRRRVRTAAHPCQNDRQLTGAVLLPLPPDRCVPVSPNPPAVVLLAAPISLPLPSRTPARPPRPPQPPDPSSSSLLPARVLPPYADRLRNPRAVQDLVPLPTRFASPLLPDESIRSVAPPFQLTSSIHSPDVRLWHQDGHALEDRQLTPCSRLLLLLPHRRLCSPARRDLPRTHLAPRPPSSLP